MGEKVVVAKVTAGKPAAKKRVALDIEAPQSFDAYKEHSKSLRTWFVAYGIGGPIFFASQEQIASKLGAAPGKTIIIALFLAGLSVQILITMLNKWMNWSSYAMALNPPTKLTLQHRVVIWLANAFWLETLADLLSVASFVAATFMALEIVLS